MSQENYVTVLAWTVPRPTGRWHQSIVVTDRDVFITPELSFAENEQMTAAAEEGMAALYGFIKSAGWTEMPQRCSLGEVDGINWNAPTGMLRVRTSSGEIISAMIPSRGTGEDLVPMLQLAIKDHVANN